jgi:hypothetical protein
MLLHLAREFGKFLPYDCKTLVCISDFRFQYIQRGYCLRKGPLCGLQCASGLRYRLSERRVAIATILSNAPSATGVTGILAEYPDAALDRRRTYR